MKNKDFNENSYQLYLKSVEEFQLLTPQEEKRLFLLLLDNDIIARELLINSNLKLVINIARSSLLPPHNIQDLIQEGTLGLIHAINKFDHTLNFRLSTYATPWIKEYISKYQQQRMIRLPQNIIRILNKNIAFSSYFLKTKGSLPTLEISANHLNISPKKLLSILSNIENSSTIQKQDLISETLNHPYDYSSNFFSTEKIIENRENDAYLKKFLNTLTPRENFIFQERYGLNGSEESSFMKIALKLNLTKEAVRQIHLKSMKRLMILAKKMKKL